MTKPYSFYKRKVKKNTYYYVRFRDPVTDERLTGISTGCKRKADAERFAVNFIKNGKVIARSRLSFKNFAAGFFNYKTSIFIKRQIDSGARYSQTYADSNNGILENHLIPKFGDKLITAISVLDIEQFMDDIIAQGYGTTTLKNIMNALSAVLSEAHRVKVISENPMDNVKRRIPRYQRRGTLPYDVIRKLFVQDNIQNIWRNNRQHFLFCLTALVTGMRQGEIQALRWKDIKTDHIELQNKWDRKYGLSSPKYDSVRTIPIPSFLRKLFDALLLENSSSAELSDFVFFGKKEGKPIDHKVINDALYNALNKIGIDSAARIRLNITFHSFRHTFVSLMRNNIEDSQLQQFTGHKSEEMIDHYMHFSMENLSEVIPVQEKIFSSLLSA
jgi:integrase